MKNLPKGIYLRGSVYWLAIQTGGKRQFFSLQTADLSSAITRAVEIKGSVPSDDKHTLEAMAEKYLNSRAKEGRHSKKTSSWSRRIIFQFIGDIGSISVVAVTENVTKRWFAEQRARMTEAAAQSYVRALKGFFSWLLAEGKIRQNPFNFRMAKVSELAKERFCSPELRNQLLENAPSPEMALILNLGFHAGLRKNEIIEARWNWVDLNAGLLRVQNTDTFQTKNRKGRTIPLSKRLEAFLASIPRCDGYIVKPDVAHGVSEYRYDFRRPFDDYMAEQGCEWVTAHTMRHTFASLLVSAGVSMSKTAIWLGDGIQVVERHYAHLIAQDSDIDRAG
ncbi:MAG: site-specific integrase [Chthoniobacterales bacterium]